MNRLPRAPARFWSVICGRQWFGLAVVSCVALILLWGCATPEQKYRWLSFFFDGVPDPNAPVIPGTPDARALRELGVNYFVHQPYDEGNCKACHGAVTATRAMLSPDSSVCLSCHEQVSQQYPVMHGPVAVGACLQCHRPHEARFRHLLRDADTRLCDQCHDRDLLLGPVPPAHQDPERGCLECHVGHGASEHNLLRVLAPADPVEPETPKPEAESEDST